MFNTMNKQRSIELLDGEKVRLSRYEIFEPLFEGMKKYRKSAMSFSLVFIWRRVIFVLSAMFMAQHAWI